MAPTKSRERKGGICSVCQRHTKLETLKLVICPVCYRRHLKAKAKAISGVTICSYCLRSPAAENRECCLKCLVQRRTAYRRRMPGRKSCEFYLANGRKYHLKMKSKNATTAAPGGSSSLQPGQE